MKLSLLALLLLAAPARGEETAAFLKIGVGARALGMGGAYTALADDSHAMAWNPAGLAGLSRRELGATHAELAADVRYDWVGVALPARHGTFGAAAAYLSQGAMEGRDASGAPTGSYKASDQAVSLGFASRLLGGLGLGANVKYVRGSIAESSAQSYAADVGCRYALSGLRGPGLPMLGLAVLNMGPGMRFLDRTSQLPLTVAAGLGYRLPAGLVLAVDYKHHPYANESDFSVGTEYALFSSFALRAGYGSAKAYDASGRRGGMSAINGMTTGCGFKLAGYSLDYSFTPMGELGNVQRFSLGARF